MLPLIGASLIGAGASLGSALFGGLLSKKGQDSANKQNVELAHEQMKWQEEMMNKQNEWNLNQWNRENEYNSPSNQVKMLRDAGINPAGVANFTGATPLESAGVNGVSMPQMLNSNEGLANAIGQALPNAVNAVTSMAQVDNIKADSDLKRSQAGYNEALTDTENAMRDGKLKLQGIEIDLGKKNILLSDQQLKRLAEETRKIKEEWNNLIEQRQLLIDEHGLNKWRKNNLMQDWQNKFFYRWLEKQKLEQGAKQIAIGWYNAITSRNLGDSVIKLNSADYWLKGSQRNFVNSQNSALRLQFPAIEASAEIEGSKTYQGISHGIDLLGQGLGAVSNFMFMRSLGKKGASGYMPHSYVNQTNGYVISQ